MTFLFKQYDQFKRDLAQADAARKKAGETATKAEGYRLTRQLKADTRSGMGADPLRVISAVRGRGAKNRKPLSRAAAAVRYHVRKDSGSMAMDIGFTGPRISKSWQRIMQLHQAGSTVTPSGEKLKSLAIALASYGKRLKKHRQPEAKYFFLRKSTRSFRLPARPIIEPFWDAEQDRSARNIEQNFKRKMRGERI